MDQNVLLKMVGITKTFPGVKALDGVNLEVQRGTVHALMGENGIFIAEVSAWLGADLILVPSYFFILKQLSRI